MGQAFPEAHTEHAEKQEFSDVPSTWPGYVIKTQCGGLYTGTSELREVADYVDSLGLPIYSGLTLYLASMDGTLVHMGVLIYKSIDR